MLGKLSENQVEELLKSQLIGRIGCHSNDTTYIVPVNYVYDGTSIYAHSSEGMKIDMMRSNPQVCFEVDDIKSIFNWQSVILWGTFEEITVLREKEEIMQKLIDRVIPFLKNDDDHPSHGITPNASDVGNDVELILYKIIISKKTGRFEKH
ncbi:MAG: pyridoxamine 5'-phosphate oxidase family protein [Bacteroidota bacterium]|nr:pyridoxamine 5'-phosphate oxidase family protein [Bacteroidota bacterium]